MNDNERDNGGKFGPGNPGRPKGAVNKTTETLRAKINAFLHDNWQQVQTDFAALAPKDKVNFYIKLVEYVLPKLQTTEIKAALENQIENMSEEDLQKFADLVMERMKEGGTTQQGPEPITGMIIT